MLDRTWIGYRVPSRSVDVERGQIVLFCKAIGEERAVHTDIKAARAAGYRGLLAPPTFAMGLDMLAGAYQHELFQKMGVTLDRALHAEQKFSYLAPICSGDVITFEAHIKDIYARKEGRLEFYLVETQAFNQLDDHVIDMTFVGVMKRERDG